jgi:hypothetical protein
MVAMTSKRNRLYSAFPKDTCAGSDYVYLCPGRTRACKCDLFSADGGIVGMIIGSFVAAFLGAGGMSLQQMTRILQIVGFAIAIPISYITFRAVVGKYLFPKIEEDEPPKT